MLDEAIHYMKFLKKQVQKLEQVEANRTINGVGLPAVGMTRGGVNYATLMKAYQRPACSNGGVYADLMSWWEEGEITIDTCMYGVEVIVLVVGL